MRPLEPNPIQNRIMNGLSSLASQFTSPSTSIRSSAFSSEAHYFEETINPSSVRSFLDASDIQQKSKGMKWLLAMMSKGTNVSDFFSAVVKNVQIKSVEVKKMVYMYLVSYADHDKECRELALLSINNFQKDLAASNQLIRALALRVLSSIRVADILQIQILAVKKCTLDSSPYVRKVSYYYHMHIYMLVACLTSIPKSNAVRCQRPPQAIQH